MNEESINTFEKGLDRDSSNQNKPKGTYDYAENLINNSEEGKFILTQEAGIVDTNLTGVPENPFQWITIGSVYIDDMEIMFQGYIEDTTAEFTDSRIGYKNIRTGEFQVVYQNHERLNFNIDYHINNPQAKKIYNGDINLYFTDNFNPPKFLRLIYQTDLSGLPYVVNQEVFNLNADFEEPIIDYDSFIEGGGQAPVSTIHFFLQYVDKYGNTTRYSNLTNGVPIIKQSRSTAQHSDLFLTNYAHSTSTTTTIPFGKINAGNYNTNSNKSIRLRLDHVDTSYSFFRIGYMYYKDNVYTQTYRIIDNLYNIPTSTDFHIDNIFQDITFFEPTLELSEDQVTQIAKKFEYTHAKCMAQNQNRLLLANLRNKYENLQDNVLETIANNIDVRVAVKKLTTDTTTYDSSELNQAYDHEQSSFRYKGYKRAEVYSFGFRLIYKGGYKSKVIHIPAKEKTTEFNSGLRYILPTSGDNLTGTYYSSDTYKVGSAYILTPTIPNIRHHVMPDWYHEDGITTESYRISEDNFLTANTTTVNALGIYFENIDLHTLPADILVDLAGIEFVRQTREEGQNKRILAQGITRLIQRPTTKSGSFPVVVDSDGNIKEFQEQVQSKLWPFANFTSPYLNIANQIEVDETDPYWDVTNDPQRHFRNDGLISGTGQYGYNNKRIDETSYVASFTDSLTAPLDSFGHISKWFMPNYAGSVALNLYTTYDEFALNLITPETEFNLLQLPSNIKLELRDRMYFDTFDVTSVDSAGNKGALVKINNTLGNIDYAITTVGSRASTGGNGLLRSADKSTYNAAVVGPADFQTKILQGSLNQNTTVLVSKPKQSKVSLSFNTRFTSDFLSTLFITDGSNSIYPNKQDIVPIPDLQIYDNYTSNNPTYKYLIKHCYCNNGLYLIPSTASHTSLKNIIKQNVNNNLRYEIGFHDDGTYAVLLSLGVTIDATFPPTPFYQKIYRSTPITDEDSTIPYNDGTVTQKLDVDYSSTPVFDIIREIPNQYGTIYNAEYFPIQVTYDIDKIASTNIGTYNNPLFSGDTFICWYGNNNGGYGENYGLDQAISLSGVSDAEEEDTWLLHKVHTYNNNIMYFPVETSVNTHFRYTPEAGVPYFPSKSITDSYNDTTVEYQLSPHFNSDNYYLNYSYNQNNINLSTAENQLTGSGGSLGLYLDRIIYSTLSVDGEIDDKYREFLADQYKDIPKESGEIWNMYQYSNDIYAHTPNALWKTFMQPSTILKSTTGDESVLGTSDVFSQSPQKILTKEGSSGGSRSAWGYMITPYGLLFIDNNGKKMYKLINDTLEEISFNGMMNFFNMYTNFSTIRGNYRDQSHYIDDTPYNPVNGHGWHFGYDDFNKRVLMTKRASVGEDIRELDIRRPDKFFKEFTVSYSFLSNSFIGFSSYLPLYYINSGNYLMSIPHNKNRPENITNYIATHSDYTNPCKFYEESPKDSLLKFTSNEYPQIEKVFDNIVIDMYNMSQAEDLGLLGYLNKTLVPNRGNTNDPITGVPIKDTIEVETVNQYSEVNELYYNHNTPDHFTHYDDNRRAVKYYEKGYRIALPKSRTNNQAAPKDYLLNLNQPSPTFTSIGNRFKDKYLQITLTWRNYERFSFLINFIKIIFRKNYR